VLLLLLLVLHMPQLLLQGCNVLLLIYQLLVLYSDVPLLIQHVLLLATHVPVSCIQLMLQLRSVRPTSCTADKNWHKRVHKS
jgi:hypothetical protein